MDQATTQFDDGFDADAWRRVLAGLTMLLAAWIAIPVVMMSFLPCILIAIAGPVAAAIVVLGGVVYVASASGIVVASRRTAGRGLLWSAPLSASSMRSSSALLTGCGSPLLVGRGLG